MIKRQMRTRMRMRMRMLIIDCYTDASYAKFAGGSFIGYKIGNNPIQIVYLENTKNTQAEVRAVDICIDAASILYPNAQLHIHTDCQKVIKKYTNGDYPEHVITHKMIGHIQEELITDEKQIIFSQVDRAARKALRTRMKIIKANNRLLLDNNNE